VCISKEQKVVEMQFTIKESKWLIRVYINPLVELIKNIQSNLIKNLIG